VEAEFEERKQFGNPNCRLFAAQSWSTTLSNEE
jgi:hypothetical protein